MHIHYCIPVLVFFLVGFLVALLKISEIQVVSKLSGHVLSDGFMFQQVCFRYSLNKYHNSSKEAKLLGLPARVPFFACRVLFLAPNFLAGVYRFTLQPFLWIYYRNISSSNQEKLNPEFFFGVARWNVLIHPFIARLVIVMATQLICICAYSCLEIRAWVFKLPCRPNEHSKIFHGWLEKASYSPSSLCCQCYWCWCCWCQIHKLFSFLLYTFKSLTSPLLFQKKKKKSPSTLSFMMEETFPSFSWNSWSHVLKNADWSDTHAAFISCRQRCIVHPKAIHGKKTMKEKQFQELIMMSCFVFFSNIHFCSFFQERSCSGGAISEMWPWKDWDPSTSTAGWANRATLAVRSLNQQLPYSNLWKAGCQGRGKKKQAVQ